ncbi:MAG: hypothetical protein HFH58_11370 [Lachnospiraceae bacterium]|nr:hypothetical protein [Lachnospiraceae bacterium]
MNLYSPNIIKNDFHFNIATYSINRHTHEETLSSIYDDENTHKSGTACFIKKAAIHTGIMEILDYDMSEKESAVVAFQKLKSVLPLLGIDCTFDEEAFNVYCCEHTLKDIEASAEQIMPILQSCFEEHPALSYLYPLFYMIMRSCYQQAGKSTNTELLQATKLLAEEVGSLESLYTQARDYLDDVIIEPSKQGLQLPSSVMAEIYHSYCLYAGKQDFQSDALSAMEMKDTFLSSFPSLAATHSNTQGWIEYLNRASNLITDNAIVKYPVTSFKQFLYIGIRLLLEDELVIKKCKLCNGYFRVKYTSNQKYCTRIYRDTSTTCNEYSSRKSYKEKLFSHPIHTEFTKSYNRLYARIRRGKLPSDTPLMDQLKALHDEYTEKYENTHQKDREAIWKEYIEKNKELLRLDSSKS